jgi:uncharacterized membrane protein YvlD (DUF360 family)
MLQRLVLALVVAVVVGLVCILLGSVLETLKVPIAETVGGFIYSWGWVIGVLAGLWYFFGGGSFNFPGRTP